MNNNQTSRKNLTLRRGSQFQAKQIILQAVNSSVSLLENSTLNTSGQSTATPGTSSRVNFGASFVGEGGSCPDAISMTYGNYSSVPNILNITQIGFQIGSMGNSFSNESSGGGRIVIIADSLTINGTGAQIQANAKPYLNSTSASTLAGGSGGYIYIQTFNKFAPNFVNSNSSVETKGGFGTGSGFGGSGGVIVFDGNFGLNAS
jgi:hypothetical protein